MNISLSMKPTATISSGKSNNDNSNSSGEEGDESRKKRGNSERKNEPENSKKVRSESNNNGNDSGATSCNGHDSKGNRSDGHGVVNKERIIEGETLVVPTTTTSRCTNSDSSSTMRIDVNKNSSSSAAAAAVETTSRNDYHDDGSNHSNRNGNTGEQQRKRQRDEVWDLESALMYLVQIGSNSISKNNSNQNAIEKNETRHAGNYRHSCSNKTEVDCKGSGVKKEKEKLEGNAHEDQHQHQDSNSNSYHDCAHDYSNSECEEAAVSREFLTLEKNSWITFRAAHAGDASSIAQWYLRKRLEERSHECVTRQRQQHRSRTILDSTRDYGSNHDNDESDTNINKEEEEVSDHEDPEIDKYPVLRHASSISDEEEPSNDRRTHIHSKPTNAAGGDDQESHARNGEECDDNEEGVHSSSLQLEHWLAEGLGDENTCPSVYGLLAYVHYRIPNEVIGKHSSYNVANADADGRGDSSAVPNLRPPGSSKSPHPPTTTDDDDLNQFCSNNLAAVVLLSLSWTSGKRNLRIEWMSVDANQLQTEDEVLAVQQKLWLRIHTLSVMTACQAIAVDENVLLTKRTAATATATTTIQQHQHQHQHQHQQSLSSSSSPVLVYSEEEPLDDENRTKPGSKNDNSTVPTHSNQVAPSAE